VKLYAQLRNIVIYNISLSQAEIHYRDIVGSKLRQGHLKHN
jgi:hypothetical protein